MTLSFSGLKDGGEAESLESSLIAKIERLLASHSEEDLFNLKLLMITMNILLRKEATFQGEQKKGLVVTVNTLMQNQRRLQE